MQERISLKNKKQIFNIVLTESYVFGQIISDMKVFLDFLREIWEIDTMPSEDDRFENATGDIIQHFFNNDDWDLEYLFTERLKIYQNDSNFLKFIETSINPKYYSIESDLVYLVTTYNDSLKKSDLQFSLQGYNEDELPIYKISEYSEENPFPFDMTPNSIRFHLSPVRGRNFVPKEVPCFALDFDGGWNDYGIRTNFNLYYFSSRNSFEHIGEVKIMNLDDEDGIINSIPESFVQLDNKYCSLGQNTNYYEKLKSIFGRNLESVLYALQDAAFFTDIQEEFENNENFKTSIIRDNSAERTLREAKHAVYSNDLKDLYSFRYCFKPSFSTEGLDVDFNFGNVDEFPNRVFALIGKNGTGKTQLITSLPIDIAEKKEDNFSPRIPLFSKVIAVSYSIFDTFKIPKKSATFSYVYCGLKNDKGEIMSEQGQIQRFHHAWKKIESLERINQWRRVLMNFLDEEIISEILIDRENITFQKNKYQVSLEGFGKARKKLSSGQGIILYVITQIVANIRFDSLLLFDEPETHLHPNAITQLMNTIYSLVNEFESYCILATHSPLVIRECFSRNVYVMEKNENTPSIRKIGLESFGENLTILTDEVFGNKETESQYKKIIQSFVEQGRSFEDIVAYIESDNVPLSLNAKIYIKSVISNSSNA